VKTSIVNGLNRDDVVAYLLAGGGDPRIEQQGEMKTRKAGKNATGK
jgi:hypothetical protein